MLAFIGGSEEASLITLHLSRDRKEVWGCLRKNIQTEGESGAKAWGRRVLLCGRHGNEAVTGERENLGVKGSRWGLSSSCYILLGCVHRRGAWEEPEEMRECRLRGRVGRASLALGKGRCGR